MPTSQRHCPYDGRWLGRPNDVCARPQCQDRLEAEVSALVSALEAATSTIVTRRYDQIMMVRIKP